MPSWLSRAEREALSLASSTSTSSTPAQRRQIISGASKTRRPKRPSRAGRPSCGEVVESTGASSPRLPRAHRHQGPREGEAEDRDPSVLGRLGDRSAYVEIWRRCGRAGGFVVRCRTRRSGETMVGAHSRESWARPSQGGEGQVGASTPCGPARGGVAEARRRGRRGRCLDAVFANAVEIRFRVEDSDRSHREERVAGRLQRRRPA